MKNNYFVHWRDLLFHPKRYFTNYFTTKDNSFFIISFIVYAIGYGINRMDTQLAKLELRGRYELYDYLNNWTNYWLIAIVLGLIGGFIYYLVGGWFYNIRIKWSKGDGDIKVARKLFLYSELYPHFFLIVFAIISTFLYTQPSNLNMDYYFDIFSMVLLLMVTFYSVYISYAGVKIKTNVSPKLAPIWFLVVPIVFYLIIYASVILLVLNAEF